MLPHPKSEKKLIAEARNGDRDAFATLFHRSYRQAYRAALRITGNRQDAEDVVQEAFLKAYTKLEQFRGDSRFSSWLVRIAINQALMLLRGRRSGREARLNGDVPSAENTMPSCVLVDSRQNPEKQCARAELRQVLAKGIEELKPDFRTVLLLSDVAGLSAKDVAKMLALSVPAVKSRLLRARWKLQPRVNEYFRTNGRRKPRRCGPAHAQMDSKWKEVKLGAIM